MTRKVAEKDLYVRSKNAEADLLVNLAEAEKVRLKKRYLKSSRLYWLHRPMDPASQRLPLTQTAPTR